MKAILAAALICAASTASAQSLIGTWTCARATPDNEALSNVTFTKSGRLDALVDIVFLGLDQEVTAQAKYRSEFTFENNVLRDTPRSASVTSLLIDGQDARRSEHAARLHDSLLETSDIGATVVFTSDNYMIISSDIAPINCVRM